MEMFFGIWKCARKSREGHMPAITTKLQSVFKTNGQNKPHNDHKVTATAISKG